MGRTYSTKLAFDLYTHTYLAHPCPPINKVLNFQFLPLTMPFLVYFLHMYLLVAVGQVMVFSF